MLSLPSSGKPIRLDAVSRVWDETVAVDALSIDIPAGSFTALLGPSGCGKSTTLRMIAGLESVSNGRILIGGEDVTARSSSKRDLSMVFQSYALFPHLSVAENIIFGLKVRRVSRADRDLRLKKVADLLGLSQLLDRKPGQLSGGQQQRVALGRAIIGEKPICLMDEPLSNLDAKLRHEMRVEIRALQQQLGFTMVYVTHDQVEAITMADQVVLLNKGTAGAGGAAAGALRKARQSVHRPVHRHAADEPVSGQRLQEAVHRARFPARCPSRGHASRSRGTAHGRDPDGRISRCRHPG